MEGKKKLAPLTSTRGGGIQGRSRKNQALGAKVLLLSEGDRGGGGGGKKRKGVEQRFVRFGGGEGKNRGILTAGIGKKVADAEKKKKLFDGSGKRASSGKSSIVALGAVI